MLKMLKKKTILLFGAILIAGFIFGSGNALSEEPGAVTCSGSWPGWNCTGGSCSYGYADTECELECLVGVPPRGTIECLKPPE